MVYENLRAFFFDLRAFKYFYARSPRFTHVQMFLRAFVTIYARSEDFTRVQKFLRAFTTIYARSAVFTRVPLTHIKNRLNVRAG